MTAPYTRAEAGRDRLDEQVATTAGNVQRLVEEITVEAAELGRLAAAGAPLSAQARKLTDCLQGAARGAARHDALTDAVKAVYGVVPPMPPVPPPMPPGPPPAVTMEPVSPAAAHAEPVQLISAQDVQLRLKPIRDLPTEGTDG